MLVCSGAIAHAVALSVAPAAWDVLIAARCVKYRHEAVGGMLETGTVYIQSVGGE